MGRVGPTGGVLQAKVVYNKIMSNFVITSYYTLDTPYQEVAHNYLMPSIQKLNLPSDIRGIQNLGSWQANTSYKSEFVLQMLEHHKKDIVFLDSDAVVVSYPKLFGEIPTEFDIACHYLDKDAWYGRKYSEQFELLSGTAFFRYCPSTLQLVSMWVGLCKKHPNTWEQQVLQDVVSVRKSRIFNLPLSYCWIVSLPDGSRPLVGLPDPIVIKHHQVSRQLRNKV